MKKRTWKTYACWIIFTEAVGALSGWLTREGAEIYNATIEKPALSPPAIVFPIVWGILFALMGIGAARIYTSPASNARSRSLLLFSPNWPSIFSGVSFFLISKIFCLPSFG